MATPEEPSFSEFPATYTRHLYNHVGEKIKIWKLYMNTEMMFPLISQQMFPLNYVKAWLLWCSHRFKILLGLLYHAILYNRETLRYKPCMSHTHTQNIHTICLMTLDQKHLKNVSLHSCWRSGQISEKMHFEINSFWSNCQQMFSLSYCIFLTTHTHI